MPDVQKPNEVTDEQFKTSVFEEGGNLVVDLQGIQEAKFELIPKGIYNAEIDSVEYSLSNNSGQPMLTLQVLINEGQYSGRKLYTFWSFSQKALPYTKATIQRIAPELNAGKFIPQRIADEGKLIGKPCRIRVVIEPYNGEDRSKIGQMLSPATGDTVGTGNGAAGAAKGFF